MEGTFPANSEMCPDLHFIFHFRATRWHDDCEWRQTSRHVHQTRRASSGHSLFSRHLAAQIAPAKFVHHHESTVEFPPFPAIRSRHRPHDAPHVRSDFRG